LVSGKTLLTLLLVKGPVKYGNIAGLLEDSPGSQVPLASDEGNGDGFFREILADRGDEEL
jgi:hypothetical protein